jgi:peptidoglycan hydrolase-like protein with peptidoglycan-binding domain
MRWTTPLLGAAIGGGIGMLKRDPARYALWGAGIGLAITFMGGAAISVGSVSIRVGIDSASNVLQAQTMLNQLGYRVPTDGILGVKTTAALKSFQTTYGLRVTGTVDTDTLATLMAYAGLGGQSPVISTTGDFT